MIHYNLGIRIMRIRAFLIGAAAAALFAGAAQANDIPLFNTGVDAGGNAFASNGNAEIHYLVNGGPAVTYQHPAWVTAGDAYWISTSSTGAFTQNPNSYTLTFDLTGFDLSSASIGGLFAVDDEGSVSLNGGAAIAAANSYHGLTSFSFNSGFVAGVNTLTFNVVDTGGAPSGLLVSGLHGTADLAGSVPEPASWAMMLGGFGLVGGAMRGRRKTAVSFG
jgi:hypothetical protein